MRSLSRGSFSRAVATFDNGPTGTRMISSVAARYVSMRKSIAPVDCFEDVEGGMSRYPPWTAFELWMSPRGIGKSSRSIGRSTPS